MITYNKIIDTKPSIVLDIDETLIKTKVYILDETKEDIIKYNKKNKLYLTNYPINNHLYVVIARPHLRLFITTINRYFNIHVYSLGIRDYIEHILQAIIELVNLNPFCNIMSNIDIHNRFSDKKIINLNIGLTNLLIIDDRSDVWKFDKHHLYKIPAFTLFDDQFIIDDNELLKVIRGINLYYKYEQDKRIFNIYKFRKILYELYK
jgi:RNA polymerase II subunit A-like phosphatase